RDARPARAARAVCCRIAVARDAAFCFYYEDNLELLVAAGAELVEWSPLAAEALPPGTDGIYLGGGYPELHAAPLGRASVMRAEIRRFAEQGGMIYAECGGFMFLQRAIRLLDASEHAMVGVFPGVAAMQSGLQALGYVELEATLDGRRLELRGQEFRHSTLEAPGPEAGGLGDSVTLVYRVRGRGPGPSEGYAWRRVLGSYIHLHFASAPEIAGLLVARAAAHRAAGARTQASQDER
ncbi:MAG TPA: cobyrinate a,c-diamide synthase, partial [Candidatus Bathyarchaeia archaeon]|nr:cobyrinate a,c-diamide synthase [Candidatus Bathyarchaeia archaeon]